MSFTRLNTASLTQSPNSKVPGWIPTETITKFKLYLSRFQFEIGYGKSFKPETFGLGD